MVKTPASPYQHLSLEKQHRRAFGESKGEDVPGDDTTEESGEQADYSRDDSTNNGKNFRD